LYEANQVWAKDAAVLVTIISRKNFEYDERPSITHQFDAGAAWENLALGFKQISVLKLVPDNL
jgi:hypothetical protein